MKKIILFIFLLSCTSNSINTDGNQKIFNFHNDLSFNQFIELLKKYDKYNKIPEID